MTALGVRQAKGAADQTNPLLAGGWTVTFTPKDLSIAGDFEVYHIVIRGPGGQFEVWLDNTFYSAAIRGDRNEYDPNQAMPVRAGQTIYFYWNVATGTAPIVYLYPRTASPL